jgi:hypothetical protein
VLTPAREDLIWQPNDLLLVQGVVIYAFSVLTWKILREYVIK